MSKIRRNHDVASTPQIKLHDSSEAELDKEIQKKKKK